MNWSQPICGEIFKKKYMINGEETPEEVFDQIAAAIASVESPDKVSAIKTQFKQELYSGRLLPAGRILSNARLKNRGIRNLNNCYTIAIEDSMDGIFNALKEDALIQKQGGGVGFDLSPLRPKGCPISKGGHSSGPISFLKIFNESAKSIHTGGDRRGAHIALMDISHPDIEEFITAKRGEENNALTQFNISVKVSDEFMLAVKEDKDWNLVFENKVYKTLKARDLFNLLCQNAFMYNEPGLFFIDTVNKYNNVPSEYTINACNPCFSGDTLVTTGKGLIPIKDLVGKDVEIFDGNKWTTVNTFKKMGENQVLYRVTLGNGLYYDCTANHNWILADGTKKQTSEIVLGDELKHVDNAIAFTKFGSKKAVAPYLKGFLLAEGCVTNNKTTLWLYDTKEVCYSKLVEDLEQIPFIGNTNALEEIDLHRHPSDINRAALTGLQGRSRAEHLDLWSSDYKKSLPREIFTWDKESIALFISGLFDGDGTVCSAKNGNSIQFNSIHKEFCVDIVRLLQMLDIRCSLNHAYPARKKIIKGVEYQCQDVWRVYIPTEDSVRLNEMCSFQRLSINFKSQVHSKCSRHYRIMSIEALPETHDVYCCQVDTTHEFMLTGKISTSNCGEQSLAPYQACCLSALNLSKFLVLDTNTKTFSFDYQLYTESIKRAVRFLDNVITYSEYPLAKNREIADKYRRVGLGFTALADTMALLGFSYDSNEGLDFCTKIAAMLRDISYEASVELAIEKGTPEGCTPDKLKKSQFIKKLPAHIKSLIYTHGLRNVALNTVAPTGTTSFSIGQNCSSGIEPIFSLSYKRTIRTGAAEGEDTKTEIVWDQGWLTYISLHQNEYETLEGASDRLYKQLSHSTNNPFKTTFDISPDAHLRIQAIWQEYIDSSISKTINLPNDFKEECYGDLIVEAHSAGLKGFTTFNPNGKMKGILVAPSKDDKKETQDNLDEESPLTRRDAPKRPIELPCDIQTMTYRGEQYLILVGKLAGSLYEVFATLLTDELSEKIKPFHTGIIYKHGKGQYSLEVEENGERKQLIKNIGRVFNSTFETVARMISMSLRHGTPLQFIVDQLGKGKDIQGFERCISRVIKKYIKDGEKSVTMCETCHVQMEYREGCLTCPTCGASKCG